MGRGAGGFLAEVVSLEDSLPAKGVTGSGLGGDWVFGGVEGNSSCSVCILRQC